MFVKILANGTIIDDELGELKDSDRRGWYPSIIINEYSKRNLPVYLNIKKYMRYRIKRNDGLVSKSLSEIEDNTHYFQNTHKFKNESFIYIKYKNCLKRYVLYLKFCGMLK